MTAVMAVLDWARFQQILSAGERDMGLGLLILASLLYSARRSVVRRNPALSSIHGASMAALPAVVAIVSGQRMIFSICALIVLIAGLFELIGIKRIAMRDLSVAVSAMVVVEATGGESNWSVASGLTVFAIGCVLVRVPSIGPCRAPLQFHILDVLLALVPGALLALAISEFGTPAGWGLLLATFLVIVGTNVAVQNVNRRESALEELADLVDAHSASRDRHSRRVAALASQTAMLCGFTRRETFLSWWCGRVADLGLPFANRHLDSDRKLTENELRTVRLHAARSSEMLDAIGLPRRLREAVLCHHERPDGKGFLGRPIQQIPRVSLAVSVADAYVALRSDRPHRARLSHGEAIEALGVGAGTQFDSIAVEAIREIVDYPGGETSPESQGDKEEKTASKQIRVIAFDPQIEDTSYRLRIVQRCGEALLDDRMPAVLVRDSQDAADLSWLSMEGVEIWAPGSMRVIGVDTSSLLRYDRQDEYLDVRNIDGSERERIPVPPASAYHWNLLSRDAIVSRMIIPAFAVLAIIAGLSMVAFPTYKVPSGSMMPLLNCGDRIVTTAIGNYREKLKVGDVVVVRGIKLIGPPVEQIVKRIAAVEGDVVTVDRESVYINSGSIGKVNAEMHQPKKVVVPKNHVYLVGDNPLYSEDSRTFGPIPISKVAGLTFAIVWPPSRWSGITGTRPRTALDKSCLEPLKKG